MTGLVGPAAAVAGVASLAGALAPAGGAAHTPDFLGLVDHALAGVSADQHAAAAKEAGYATGRPGASLGDAVVASDRAEVAWNATVAVRNEVVTAYQSIMNMQF